MGEFFLNIQKRLLKKEVEGKRPQQKN